MGLAAKIGRMTYSWFPQTYASKITGWKKHKLKDTVEAQYHSFSVSEVTEAEKRIVRFVQRQSFSIEIDKSVIKSQLARLKPFEEEGILHVGVRLIGYCQENTQLLSW